MDREYRYLKISPRRGPALACLLLALAAAAPAIARPQDPPPAKRVYTARHVNPHAPVIDGKADEPAWEKAEWQGDFVQREPYEGAAPTEKTEFKILYDDKAVYVLIRAADSKAGTIERRVARRDNVGGDWVDITLDSYFDHLTGFCFGVNAGGVKSDQLLSNGGMSDNDQDTSWDPIWDVATSMDDGGWTAEMKIPFSQLRFGEQARARLGPPGHPRACSATTKPPPGSPSPRTSPGWVHMFGELRGIAGIRPPRQIEIVPYTVGKLQCPRGRSRETRSPPAGARSLLGGLDGKVGVTHDLTLNFTVNPDFGQVEADPSVVNLTAFETYYQEKRPFFIEGRSIFELPADERRRRSYRATACSIPAASGGCPSIPPGRGRPRRYARGDDHPRGVQADRARPEAGCPSASSKASRPRRRRPSLPPAGSATGPSSR